MNIASRAGGWIEKHFSLAVQLMLVGIFLFYQLLFLSYRPYEVDNPWSLSFSYGYGHAHISNDQFMSAPFPGGQDGTYFFGKIAAIVQTVALEPFHWQQRPAEILSALLLVLALGCWAAILRRCGASRSAVLCFLFVAAVSDPFVHAAERFRYEPLTLLFAGAAMLCALRGWTFAAILLAALPAETQPVAVFAAVPVVALLWTHRRSNVRRMLAESAAAVACFLFLEFRLHPVMLHPAQLKASMRAAPLAEDASRYLGLLYYFVTPQHLPETAFFGGVALLLFLPSFRRRYLPLPGRFGWLLASIVVVLALNPLFPHVNFAYDPFLYVLLVAAVAAGVRTPRGHAIFAAGAALLFLPQYAGLAWLNRGQGYSSADIRRVSAAVASAERAEGIPDSQAVLIGDYSLWFAHPDNFHANTTYNLAYFPKANLLLCYNARMKGTSQPPLMLCDSFKPYFPDRTLLGTQTVRGNTLFLYGIHPSQQGSGIQRN